MFTLERIKRLSDELRTYIYPNLTPIENWKIKPGRLQEHPTCDANDWNVLKPNDRWGGFPEKDRHAWFRTDITIPEDLNGKTVVLHVKTGTETGWDLANPQLIIYVDGVLIQGLDIRHRDVILCERAIAGQVYKIAMFGYCGINGGLVELKAEISGHSAETENLYYDILAPYQISEKLDPNDKNYIDITNALNQALNILDLRAPNSERYLESVNAARMFLRAELYDKNTGSPDINVACVGHTHIDTAWLWTLSQTREKVVRSYSTVHELMDRYPEYLFLCSQPQLYEFLKEEAPEVYEKTKDRIKEGRWEPEGAMWVESDCNIPGGESLVRQIMFGTRFFEKEFGVKNEILWLPDAFGFSAALPQIMKKSGLKYFLTSKLGWNELNEMPYDSFYWQGIDGSEALAHFITAQSPTFMPRPYAVSYNGRIDAPHIMSAWRKYQQKSLHNEVIMAFGYGDGGGGPTREMLEMSRRFEKGLPGCPKTKMSKAIDFYKNLETSAKKSKKFPKWSGELYLEYHRGTLTSMARNKRNNRKAEILLQNAELWSVIAERLTGRHYDKDKINAAWKRVLINQFHDILPGTAIKEVYEDCDKDYEKVFDIGGSVNRSACGAIVSNISLDADSVIVFNPSSHIRGDVVSVQTPSGRLKFFADNVPAKGYKAFSIIEAQKSPDYSFLNACLQASVNRLENRFFCLELDENANLISIYDKINEREILREGRAGNVLQAFEDKPLLYDAWNIPPYFEEKMWEINGVKSVCVLKDENYSARLRIVKTFMDSEIKQDIVIYGGVPRIDFETVIDWKEKDIMVKTAFPVDINADKASYEVQFGAYERPAHRNTPWDKAKFEVCGHRWADLSEAGYGVSLMNDCKYGYDIHDGVMRLTLIRSAADPNPDADREIHRFTYSLYPHAGDWRSGGTVAAAYDLNNPMLAVFESAQLGVLPKSFSLVSVSKPNVVIDTVKQAEDSGSIIIRLYESEGRRTKASVSSEIDMNEVWECGLMEDRIEKLNLAIKSFEFEIKPYEIKTFELTGEL